MVRQLINLTLCKNYLHFLEHKELEVLNFVGIIIALELDFVWSTLSLYIKLEFAAYSLQAIMSKNSLFLIFI